MTINKLVATTWVKYRRHCLKLPWTWEKLSEVTGLQFIVSFLQGKNYAIIALKLLSGNITRKKFLNLAIIKAFGK